MCWFATMTRTTDMPLKLQQSSVTVATQPHLDSSLIWLSHSTLCIQGCRHLLSCIR